MVLDLEKADVLEEDMILPNWNILVVDDDQPLCEINHPQTGAGY